MRSLIRPGSFLALLFVVVATMSSCSEYRAKTRLQKTTELLARMQELNGQKHAGPQLDAIRETVNRANQELAGGNASAALATANGAYNQAEQALVSIMTAEAGDKYTEAIEEIRVGDKNNASQRDAVRYQLIAELKQKLDERKQKNDNEDVINISRKIIDEMTTLLQPILTRSKRAQAEAEAKLTELKGEGGQEYAPEVVIAVADTLTGAVKIATEDRDYSAAETKFQSATSQANDGITQVKRLRAKEKIEQIENLLGTAVIEGANQYVPREFERVSKLLEDLNSNYASEQYDRVIQGAGTTLEEANRLVLSTKRAAADARIKTIEDNIRDLSDGGTREYLPGRVEELEAILEKTKTVRLRDAEEAFDEIKQISIQAADVRESILKAFDAIALDAIRAAGSQLETTSAVNAKAATVFDPITGPMTEDQKVFEDQKKARAAELTQEIENARKSLQDAFQREATGKYKAAILLANEVKAHAENVTDEIYHMVGHNAAIELAGLISRYERDGAREYAKDELERSTAQLEAVKGAIAAKKYRDSVKLAAEARANIELMAQRIAGRATENLQVARAALKEASTDRTRHYRGDMLQKAAGMISESENDLAAQHLKGAVEKARGATDMAAQAVREAAMESAREGIAKAEKAIERAQTAGADGYAGREIWDAKSLLSSAQTLYTGEDYDRSDNLAKSSYERADAALFKKVIDAETALASAKAVGGWETNPDALGEAGAKARQARQEIENGNYSSASMLADSSMASATAVANESKNKNFHKTVRMLRANLETGTQQGINFFQPEESAEIRETLTSLENQYTLENYDRVMADLSKVEGKLRGTLETTGATLNEVADQQEKRLDQLVADGAISYSQPLAVDARHYLQYARLDFRRGNYKSAHSSLTRAVVLISEIGNRHDKEGYSAQVRDLIARYQQFQVGFGQVLRLDAAQLKGLAIKSGATNALSLSSSLTPSEFRDGIEKLFAEASLLDVPEGYEDVQTSLLDSLNKGRVSAINFERMIGFDALSERQVSQTIDDAYRNLNDSNSVLEIVRQRLADDEARFRSEPSQVGAVSAGG